MIIYVELSGFFCFGYGHVSCGMGLIEMSADGQERVCPANSPSSNDIPVCPFAEI